MYTIEVNFARLEATRSEDCVQIGVLAWCWQSRVVAAVTYRLWRLLVNRCVYADRPTPAPRGGRKKSGSNVLLGGSRTVAERGKTAL